MMDALLERIAVELERPRPLLSQVVDHICSNYDVSRDELGEFLASRVEQLEEYEIDLIFSPMFTPSLEDQALFSDLVELTPVCPEQWPALDRALEERPCRARLVVEDGRDYTLRLYEVTIARYVHRLNLDGSIPDPLLNLINSLVPPEDRGVMKAIARRPIWRHEVSEHLLFQYLVHVTSREAYDLEEIKLLLKFMELYRVSSPERLLERLPEWQEVIRNEIEQASYPKPFFNEKVREMHGGGRDQRGQETVVAAAKKRELTFLERWEAFLRQNTFHSSGS